MNDNTPFRLSNGGVRANLLVWAFIVGQGGDTGEGDILYSCLIWGLRELIATRHDLWISTKLATVLGLF